MARCAILGREDITFENHGYVAERCITDLENAVAECLGGKFVGSLDHSTVVLGTPAGRIDVDVLRVEAQRSRLHRVTNVAVQHTDTYSSHRHHVRLYIQLYFTIVYGSLTQHTHPLNGPLSGTTQVSRYHRKVKPIWILLEQETVSGCGISWAVCKSAPRSRQNAGTPPLKFFTGRMPLLPPNQQCQSTEA